MKTLLLVTLLLPTAGAILAGLGRTHARCWALAASLATLIHNRAGREVPHWGL